MTATVASRSSNLNPNTNPTASREPSKSPLPTLATPNAVTATAPKIDSLTSLRFFAALMIFVGHATALSPPNRPNFTDGTALWQGVSFFFVLSGFILAYVYPKLDTMRDAGKFLLARFARIWPTHFVSFLLTLCLVPTVTTIPNVFSTALINLCMLQVWLLDGTLAASFNKVSWTISVEAFFYVCFPFLIKDFNRPVPIRMLTMAALSLSFLLLCLLPALTNTSNLVFPQAIYVGLNPLGRLAEFILGIALCRVFVANRSKLSISLKTATALELLALAAACMAVAMPSIWPEQQHNSLLYTLRAYVLDIGGAPAYGALILIVACGRGLMSKLLSSKFLVTLGEISFSLYMFHLSLLLYLVQYQPSFANQPDWLLPVVALALCLLVAHLNYTLIETPCRKKIMSLVATTRHTAATTKALPLQVSNLRTGKLLSALTEVLAICLIAFGIHSTYRFIPTAIASRVEAHSVPNVRGVEFGGRYKLRGFKLTRQSEGMQLNEIWESLADQRLDYTNGLHLIDAQGRIASAHDYFQDAFTRRVRKGQLWEDKIFLNKSQMKGVCKIGILLYKAPPLPPLIANTSAPTDCAGQRVLISLE
jgi:peptidoglycan/LPS O-acetylase OafA/YrhL